MIASYYHQGGQNSSGQFLNANFASISTSLQLGRKLYIVRGLIICREMMAQKKLQEAEVQGNKRSTHFTAARISFTDTWIISMQPTGLVNRG